MNIATIRAAMNDILDVYAGMIMSLFDVLDRNFFHIYKTIDLDFMFTIPFSIMFATLIYVRIQRY